MANQGFAGAGSGGEDFEALARQYWNRWGEMLRAGGVAAPGPGFSAPFGMPGATAVPGWNEALAWWSQQAGASGQPADAAMHRSGAELQGWFAQMQQLVAQFAGQDAAAGDIAAAWKHALGGDGNPFADAIKGMHGPGQQGFEQWLVQVAPWLEQLAGAGRSWLDMPAFGFTREHQQRWQHLAQAYADSQQQARGYHGLMAEAGQDAFRRFEAKLAERSAPGRQLQSARALFDLWVDAAEEAYAGIALSPRFREAYGALVDAQMRLRAAVQREVEAFTDALGIPTRTEVDAAHRKVAQLERELRRLRDRLDGAGLPAEGAPAPEPVPANKGAGKAAATVKPARSRATGKAPQAPGASKAAPKTAARKTPARKTPARGPADTSAPAPGKPASKKTTASGKAAARGKAR